MSARSAGNLLVVSLAITASGCFPEYTFRADGAAGDVTATDVHASDIGMDARSSDGGMDAGTDAYVSCVPPGDGGSGGDGGGDAASCAVVTDGGGMAICPAVFTNPDPSRLRFYFTTLEFTRPATISANQTARSIIGRSIAAGGLLWGFELNAANPASTTPLTYSMKIGALHVTRPGGPQEGLLGATMAYFGTGAGRCGLPEWAPVETQAVSGDQLTPTLFTSDTVALFHLPSFSGPDMFFDLPLRDLRLVDVHMDASRRCIGTAAVPYNSCDPGGWNTIDPNVPADDAGPMAYGTFTARIRIEDARRIQLPLSSTTFCDLLAGPTGCDTNPNGWAAPPDALADDAGNFTGWVLAGHFTAAAVNIE